MTRPFRPSNGSHRDSFMAGFCFNQCVHFRPEHGPPCAILGRVLAYDIDDDEYPREWVREDDGSNARCTAFQLPTDPDQPPVTPRCNETKDLFE
jgi:hypothetical protein